MNPKEMISGLTIMVIGAITIFLVGDLEIGTPRRMGPGFFPTLLGGVLLALGVGIVLGGMKKSPTSAGDNVADVPYENTLWASVRPLLVVLGAVAIFALLIRRTGLVPAVAVTVFVSLFAAKAPGTLRAVILVICVPIAALLIFRVGLGLSIPAFTWRP